MSNGEVNLPIDKIFLAMEWGKFVLCVEVKRVVIHSYTTCAWWVELSIIKDSKMKVRPRGVLVEDEIKSYELKLINMKSLEW